MTTGGGRGAHHNASGDFPIAALAGVKTQSFEHSETDLSHATRLAKKHGKSSTISRSTGGGRGKYFEADGDVPAVCNWTPDAAVVVNQIGITSGINFVVISWNACGMEKCAENDVVDLLGSENVYWDALLIQEGPTSDKIRAKMINGGHLFYTGKPGPMNRAGCIL